MADIRIIYSPDKVAAAARLREAIVAEGYDVASDEMSDLEELFETQDPGESKPATVLIWSRPFASSALRAGLLRQLRQQRNLIEVSADGIGPQSRDGDDRIILISGWRGQPFHPGWQRIASELKRLSPPRADAPQAPVASTSRPVRAAEPQRATARPAAGEPRPGSRRLALGLVAIVALIGVLFAAITWIGNTGASEPRQEAPAKAQPASVPPAALRSDAAPAPMSKVDPAANATPAPLEPSDIQPQPAAAPPPSPTSSTAQERSKAAARKSGKGSASPAAQGASTKPGAKRYSRQNSKVMRLFCEGSGRSTPQCKTFLSSTGTRRR